MGPSAPGSMKRQPPLGLPLLIAIMRKLARPLPSVASCLPTAALCALSALAAGSSAARRHTRRDRRRAIMRRASELDKHELQELMGELPAWVKFPDMEKAAWLDAALAKLWPSLDEAVCHILRTNVERAIARRLVGRAGISTVVFNDITLGDVAPHIGGVKTHSDDGRVINLDLELTWSSELAATLAVQFFGVHATVPLLLDTFSLRGLLRVTFGPLRGHFPLFEAIDLQFLRPPKIDLRLGLVGADVTGFGPLKAKVDGVLRRVVGNLFTYPNKLHVRTMRSLSARYQVRGVLKARVAQVYDVADSGMFVLAGGSRGGGAERVPADRKKAAKVEYRLRVETMLTTARAAFSTASKVPEYDEDRRTHVAVFPREPKVYVIRGAEQELLVRVCVDECALRSGGGAEPRSTFVLGTGSVPVNSLAWGAEHIVKIRLDRAKVLLELSFYPSLRQSRGIMPASPSGLAASAGGAENGTVNVGAVPAAQTPRAELARARSSDSDASSPETFDWHPLTSPQVLVVEILRASNVRAADWGGTSDPYAVVSAGEQKFTTKTIYSTLNPVWDEVAIFSLNIVDMGVHKVQIGVYDKDMGFIHDDGLGFAEVDLAEVDRATGEHPRQSFKLEARDKDGPTACGEIHARVMLFPILTDMSSTRLRFADVKRALGHSESKRMAVLERQLEEVRTLLERQRKKKHRPLLERIFCAPLRCVSRSTGVGRSRSTLSRLESRIVRTENELLESDPVSQHMSPTKSAKEQASAHSF